MSETLAISVFAAIGAMAVALKFLHRQNTSLNEKMLQNKDDHAKCMEQHGRTEERSIYLASEVTDLKAGSPAIREEQKAQKATIATVTNSVPSLATKDTELGK